MENIGNVLKERRIELGYSLEEMSVKTKLSTVQLKAIEDGNISFFKEDLSYLSYFVRYYANALNINYDEIRGDLSNQINDYTDAISVKRVQEAENINTSIMQKVKSSGEKAGLTRAKRKSRIDLTSVGLFALVAVVVLVLSFVFFTKILPAIGDQPDSPIVTNPKPGDDNETEEKPTEPEKPSEPEAPEATALVVTQETPNLYLVSGWTEEDAVFELVVNSRTWVQFSVNGAVLENPASTIYEKDADVTIVTKPALNTELVMNLGYVAGNKIKLNGNEIPLDASVANITGSQVITFKFVGGNE